MEACRISKQLGVPVMASSAMPAVKLSHIKDLQDKGHKVAMVRSLEGRALDKC